MNNSRQRQKRKKGNKYYQKFKKDFFYLEFLGMELQEKETPKVKEYKKSVQKEPTVKRCLLALDLKPLISQPLRSYLSPPHYSQSSKVT